MKAALIRLIAIALAAAGAAAGCTSRTAGPEVVAYAALDREFSEPVFNEFKQETGITVLAKYDTESTKTVGLATAIMEEAARPRCDVFWNNEILNTLRLEKRGLLEPYESPADKDFPAMYRSPRATWHAFAARARVLIVNTEELKDEKLPNSVRDLADGHWKGRAGLAKPLFGTTATHAACLFAYWGADEARQFFREIKDNGVHIMAGNSHVARAVASGQLAFGLTDTDDAIAELDKAMPVAIIYPDQAEEQMGTLFIPNTVSIIKGCPHQVAARRLVDFVLDPSIEAQLAAGASAQIPLGSKAETQSRLKIPSGVRHMQVDFDAAADIWDAAAKFLSEEFTGGQFNSPHAAGASSG
ncbi:MAG: extracellular solute-binding protein [Planctomycetia bacterium]|nr:extracellular solute-binding protein [Planctomycetia bacterium]